MTTAHMKFDQTSDKIADRVRNLRSSAVRDLFAAAVRPDIISLSGGMPDVSLLPQRAIQKAVHAAITDERAVALAVRLDERPTGNPSGDLRHHARHRRPREARGDAAHIRAPSRH